MLNSGISASLKLSLVILAMGVAHSSGAQSGLFISSGDTVTVTPGSSVHLEGAYTGAGTLYLKADGSAYAQLSQADGVTNTGTALIEKQLANTNAGWRGFSFPFTGNYSSLDFKGSMTFIHSGNNGGASGRDNFFAWNGQDAGGGVATGWEALESSDAISNAAFVYLDNGNGVHGFNQLIQVSGVPSNGQVDHSMYATLDPNYSGSTPSEGTGWVFVGNPYPSNISIYSLLGDASFPAYKAVHVLDQKNGGNYIAILESGIGTAINYNTAGGSTTAITHLEPFQGFWVKTDVNTTVSIKNSMRDVNSTATAYMKTDPNLGRLNIIASDGTVDQAVIYFDANATDDFDLGLEAVKKYADSDVPSISLFDASNHHITIMALENDIAEHIVPLEITSHLNGVSHQIELDANSLYPGVTFYLEDTQTSTSYNLNSVSPSIVVDASAAIGRYQLRIVNSAVSLPETNEVAQSIAVWNTQSGVQVEFPQVQNGDWQIIGTSGRILQSGHVSDSSEMTSVGVLTPGLYVFRFTSDSTGAVSNVKFIVNY